MRILLTVFGDDIAPRFDLATEVVIVDHDGQDTLGEPRSILLAGKNGDELSDLVLKENIGCIICGGIEKRFFEFFTWKKITVVDGIIGRYDAALERFLQGDLIAGTVLNPAASGAQ